ncbi:pyrroline-5-carboxylate reductase [Cladophialophora psammophila CBS 110553]|uniref:Pyrroline-5-carboxylate reductase n=1 Tax=Cladophialophora psammophila CBS 110553 TaxID=1182543 RepID=W9WX61_9EURO|nr:pyrroline-5-carboxylate reductase [Cladophialophora psammophila CBS 110553]EXJ72533.1 pyrroline-5-carboxylate reductase [Cladophialophora psammophila CBS 110553]
MAAMLRVPNGINGLDTSSGMTLTILGCGTLGIAILSGILSSLSESSASHAPSPAYPDSGTATPTTESPPQRTPSNFIACVRRPESAKRIKVAVQSYRPNVTILQNENVKGTHNADVVILGCKPYMVSELLREEGMKEALAGKLLISICAGVPVEQIGRVLYGESYPENIPENACRIVRVMPNTAAIVRESMTVIANTTPPLPAELSAIVEWVFTRIGRVVHLPPAMMDVSTALCGSGPAFLALMLESLADGAVAMGLPRAEAQLMAAQTMRGTAGMVLSGEHPALVREKVSTPGGCTIGGLLVLEEGRVRGTVARSVREATVVAAQLGKGVSGVNGTRFERQ